MNKRIRDQMCKLGLHQYKHIGNFPYILKDILIISTYKCINCNFRKYITTK